MNIALFLGATETVGWLVIVFRCGYCLFLLFSYLLFYVFSNLKPGSEFTMCPVIAATYYLLLVVLIFDITFPVLSHVRNISPRTR